MPTGLRETVILDVDGLNVVVVPDEVREGRDAVVLRRVRTGRRSAKEEDELVYALYLLAARRRYGPAVGVEAIHLGEEVVTPIGLTPKKMANREAKVRSIAARILAGEFPPEPDDRTCPR